MHVMKVIWLLLATYPCMSRGLTDASRLNIQEEVLEEILNEDGNHEIRSLLQGESAEANLINTSPFRYRNPLHTSKRTQQVKKLECCPSVVEKIAPLGGVSRRGRLLLLYRANNTVQKFYHSRCLPGVANKPCQYIDSEYTSKCVQLYTYMYALVKYPDSSESYRLDYIRMKSGCSCQILT